MDILNPAIQKQISLADYYKYKPLPPHVAYGAMSLYISQLPREFWTTEKYCPYGAQMSGKDMSILTTNGTVITENYERVVIGHYGAFIEISDENINKLFLKVKDGEEYRINDPKYADHIKYEWWTTTDGSDCKLYFQRKTVDYADYKVGYWYISPHEVKAVKR